MMSVQQYSIQGDQIATYFALIFSYVLGGILLIAGTSKLRSEATTKAAAESLGMLRLAGPISRALPAVEIVLGTALVLGIASPPIVDAVLVLFLSFGIVVGRAVAVGSTGACACFGSSSRSEIGASLALRCTLFAVMAAVVAAFPIDGARDAVIRWISSASGMALDSLTLGIYTVSFILLVDISSKQNGGGARSLPSATDAIRIGAKLPNFVLPDTFGIPRILHDIMADGPKLIIFVNAGCRKCKQLLTSDAFRQASAIYPIILIRPGSAESSTTLDLLGVTMVLLLEDSELLKCLRIRSTPTGLHLSAASEILAKPMVGPGPIRTFLLHLAGAVPVYETLYTQDEEPGERPADSVTWTA
jgi:hypothetical protein